MKDISLSFNRLDGWLEWWLRPNIASMIFPAKSRVDPELASQLPSTSNPVEAAHSHLHSAMGTGYDAHQGVHKLFVYVKERETRFNALMGMSFSLSTTYKYTNYLLCRWTC